MKSDGRGDLFARAVLERACFGIGSAAVLGLVTRLVMRARLDAGTAVGIVVVACCAASILLSRRGRVHAATALLLTVSAAMVVGISIARGPSYPATIPLFLLLILLAALVGSSRAAITLAVFASVATPAVWLLHEYGLVPTPEPIGLAYRLLSGGVVIAVVTITALAGLRRMREANEELAAKNAELERTRSSLAEQVEARTESLVLARDAAEAASRAKTAFLTNMSHELRTPMNAVLGSTELLLATDLDDAQRELATTVKGGGEALLAVLNDVLDLSAVEAGRLAVDKKPFDPRAVLADVANLFRTEVRKAGLELVVETDESLPASIEGDPARVRQVLLNLVGNAVKFTERGTITLRVLATAGQVLFAVIDTGPGIDEAHHDLVFQPFTQLDSSSTRRRGGLGLGLAIARELATLMGGTIAIASVLGRGCTFSLSLPLVAATVVPQRLTRKPPRMRILVAEDNEVNARVLVHMLAHFGLAADVVSSGAAALAAVRKSAYDCVLMDVHMPEMDGVEATRRIRGEMERAPGIVAVTADALPEQRAQLLAAGFDDVITKPVLLDALADALIAAAARGQAPVSPVSPS